VPWAGGHCTIGALTTHASLAADADVRQKAGALWDAANALGDPQVRNLGTIGGACSHADPSADYPAVMLALDACFIVTGEKTREIAAADFFKGTFETALGESEILTKITFDAAAHSAYVKLEHPASHYALVGVAAVLVMSRDTIEDVIEPYLLQQGFLGRTPRGRVATRKASEHLRRNAPASGGPHLSFATSRAWCWSFSAVRRWSSSGRSGARSRRTIWCRWPPRDALRCRSRASAGPAKSASRGRTRRERRGGDAIELAAELLLDEREHLVDAEPVDDVFEPRLGAVGAVAVVDEDAHDRVGDRCCLGRPHHHAGLAAEVAVPGDAAQREAEIDAGRDAESVLHLDRHLAGAHPTVEHLHLAVHVAGNPTDAVAAVGSDGRLAHLRHAAFCRQLCRLPRLA